jgi:hypothetical protein
MLPGFFKEVSEFLIMQHEQWSGRLVEPLTDFGEKKRQAHCLPG